MTRNIVITGGNSGIGKEMARALAADGDRVVIASSNTQRSEAVLADIRAETPDARLEVMALDLSDFEAIDCFADRVRARMPVIDVLVLNAGLYTHGERRLPNGLETMIGIMHFGHFRLVQKLLSTILVAAAGRIVITSSAAHWIGRINAASFVDPSVHRMALSGYAQAKLANLLFTRELARRLADTRITVNAFHPGSVTTGIWQELPRVLQRLVGLFLIGVRSGADTGVWLARAPEAARHSGDYFFKRKPAASSAHSRDDRLAAWLWRDSEARM